MTELAYLADMEAAYVRRFSAQVTALPPGAVVLDRTYFYPAGGGQRADRGVLELADRGEFEIADVTKSGSAVLHRVARSKHLPPEIGATVVGVLDWPRRHRHMRLHSGQHLLSALAFRQTGLRTRQASMTDTSGVLDLDGSWPSDASFVSLREEFRGHVERDLSVSIRQLPRAEWTNDTAPRSGLVAVPAHVDPVRVIDIDTVDRCPCGGTHVRSTGEIGSVAIAAPVPIPGGGNRVAFTLDGDAATTPNE